MKKYLEIQSVRIIIYIIALVLIYAIAVAQVSLINHIIGVNWSFGKFSPTWMFALLYFYFIYKYINKFVPEKTHIFQPKIEDKRILAENKIQVEIEINYISEVKDMGGGKFENKYSSPKEIQIIERPKNGKLSFGSKTVIIYRKNSNFYGVDQFKYRIYDGDSYSNVSKIEVVFT